MDTRLARKRRWTSPEKRTARTSLDFNENTPPAKRLRDSSTESDDEESQFNVKSFYGRREKKGFPHSPSRRKAATKIISKLNSDEEEFLTLRKQVPGEVLKINNKVKKDVFKLSSTSSDSEPVEILKERTRNNRLKGNKISPRSAGNKAGQRKMAKTPEITKKKLPVNNKTKTAINNIKLPPTPVTESADIATNETEKTIPGRKFFKSKSPASASKAMGSVIISKGFNLKFLPRRRSMSSLPKQSPSQKPVKKCETKEIFDDSASRNSDSHDTQAVVNSNSEYSNKDVNISLDSGFDSRPSDLSSQCTPTKSSRRTAQRSVDSPRTRSSVVSSPANRNKKNKTFNLSPAKESDIVSCDGSADLFADSIKTGDVLSETGSEMENNKVGDIETGSEMSGPSSRLDKKYFPIFNGTSNTSPTVNTGLSKTLRRSSPRQSPRLRSRLEKDNKEQMVLDAGQKKFGAVQCEVCGMVYRHADPSDEATHEKFHQDLLNVLKFPGWKKERVVQEFPEDCSRIIMVLHDDPKYAVKKIEDINKVMGQEMGFPESSLIFTSKYKAFLYISEDKKVVGCCIAEPVQQGYKVLPDSQPSQSDNPQPGHRPWYCHPDPEPAAVGISRIWVFGQERRKGIARKLLDAVRQWFEYGVYIETNQVAFSDPTSDGRQLASKYTGTPAFLVYKYT